MNILNIKTQLKRSNVVVMLYFLNAVMWSYNWIK